MGEKRAKVTIAVVIDDGETSETKIFESEGTTDGGADALACALLTASKADAWDWADDKARS